MRVDPNDPIRLVDIPPASPFEQAEHNLAVAQGALSKRVLVKILEDIFAGSHGGPGYVAGDVAGFEPSYAEHLVKSGHATFDINAGPKPAPRAIELANGAPTAAAAGSTALRMLKAWGNLVPGDVAGFNPALARELMVKGVAEPVDTTRPKRTLRMIRDAIMGRR